MTLRARRWARDDIWLGAQESAGDRLTLTQHISTGSYGVNIRWHYDYACN